MKPENLLYSIAAGVGGTGLDLVAAETLGLANSENFLGRVVAYSNNQSSIPSTKFRLLQYHPVKALSFLPRDYYVGAKKHALDAVTAAELAAGSYDIVHTWSGDALRTLRVARQKRIPSVLEIPTWHRNKGRVKKDKTWSEIQRDSAPFPRSLLNRLLVTRQQVMAEYDLADLILVLSQKARETFLIAGVPEERLFQTSRGVDPEAFHPAPTLPDRFHAIFVGSLSKRKGVHVLLEAWNNLRLPNARLTLVGNPSKDIEPWLENAADSVTVTGHVNDVAGEMRNACVHVFPSECEGSAKVTYEASSCGLPQITTREAGDVVVDGETGILIPPNDPKALAEALRTLNDNPQLRSRLGQAGRRRILQNFTWDHYRDRVMRAYESVLARSQCQSA